jgi:hypothetical protein
MCIYIKRKLLNKCLKLKRRKGWRKKRNREMKEGGRVGEGAGWRNDPNMYAHVNK